MSSSACRAKKEAERLFVSAKSPLVLVGGISLQSTNHLRGLSADFHRCSGQETVRTTVKPSAGASSGGPRLLLGWV